MATFIQHYLLSPSIIFLFSALKIERYALYDLKISNSFANCYTFVGTPMIGVRKYDPSTNAFVQSSQTIWKPVCALPWTRNEQEVTPVKITMG